MSQEQLQDRIIELSESNEWYPARGEWSLLSVYLQDEPDTCLCGHNPIHEICVLQNRTNGNETIVGNVCVNELMGLGSDLIFQGIKRVSLDKMKAINEAATEFAYSRGWLNDWEYGFCNLTRRKRKLSGKQKAKRVQINERLLNEMSRNN